MPEDERFALFMRVLMGFIAMACLYSSIQMLSLSKSQTYYYTGPVYVGILAYIVFKERIAFSDILSVVLAFSGILLINNPFASPKEGTINDSNELMGTIIAILGGFGMACSQLCMRKLKKTQAFVTTFYFSLGCAVMAPIMSLNSQSPDFERNVIFYVMIVAAGIFMLGGQVMQNRAYQLEKVSRISGINYFIIVMSFIYDIMLFGETIGWTDIVGTILIIGVNVTLCILRCFNVIS